MPVLQLLLGLLTGKAGEKIGSAVSGVAQLGALVAVIAPLALWLSKNKDDVFIVLTYADLAFWGLLFGGFAFLIVRLVHRAAPPA